jgi:hypothetical protein
MSREGWANTRRLKIMAGDEIHGLIEWETDHETSPKGAGKHHDHYRNNLLAVIHHVLFSDGIRPLVTAFNHKNHSTRIPPTHADQTKQVAPRAVNIKKTIEGHRRDSGDTPRPNRATAS